MSTIRFENGQRVVNDLVPYEKNPRKISAAKKKQLTDLVEKYGLISTPIIDQDGTLVSGHQRLKALQLLGRGTEPIDVRVASRKLTEAEFKEVMVIENAKFGEWDAVLLKDEFADLLNDFDFGIDFATLDADVAEMAGVQETPEMPIVAKFSEQYQAIVIVSTNEIDQNNIAELLRLGQAKSYKSERVGQTRVITAKQFVEAWNAKS
ncbi:ParB N-terminal domain-containing protein [Fibrella aquatilis]|uniref:ParB N-terminal domain-containing protein n=1 Tax=Fibrella aquatilis TaxID=2817059 RepID=A0A939GAY9_9BACT|nr:ParB N-terminal domain-containing protein [Fibrella aquatilis]MBO0933914.1 ParB N-terminal domain-containing protein [Fibrella aquatilis]